MYAEAIVFLRFGCYVHNPDAIYAKASPSVIQWLANIQDIDSEWGFKKLSKSNSHHTVVSINVPNSLHHALLDIEANYTYTSITVPTAKSIISAKRNTLRLTSSNIRKLLRITRTTPMELVTVLESYLHRIEVNPVQPVSTEELTAIKHMGVSWDLAARLPRLDENALEPIYIVDEHHRIKCL